MCIRDRSNTVNHLLMHFSLAQLLSKFRIDYSDLIVIPDITKKAKEETKKEFESLIANFREKENSPETSGMLKCHIILNTISFFVINKNTILLNKLHVSSLEVYFFNFVAIT